MIFYCCQHSPGLPQQSSWTAEVWEFEGFWLFFVRWRWMVWVFKFRKHYNYTIYIYTYICIYIYINDIVYKSIIFMLSVVLVRVCIVYLLYVLSLVSLSVPSAVLPWRCTKYHTTLQFAPRLNYEPCIVVCEFFKPRTCHNKSKFQIIMDHDGIPIHQYT